MKCAFDIRRFAASLCFAAVALFAAIPAPAQEPLSAADIIKKAVDRVQSPDAAAERPDYCYLQRTIIEELDSKGALKTRKEKLQEVRVQSGLSYIKLIQQDGRKLSATELKKQEAHDLAERQKMTDTKDAKKGDDRERFLTADLVERYKFTLVRKEALNGRAAYVLTFEPRSSNLPVRKLTDRVLNQIAGKIWVDTEEFEIARAEMHLVSEVTLWGGVLGTLRQSDFTLERKRLPEGIWFSHFSHGLFEGRKLLDSMRYRTRSEATDFQRLDTAMK